MTKGMRKAKDYWARLRRLEQDERAGLKAASGAGASSTASTMTVSWVHHSLINDTHRELVPEWSSRIGDGPDMRAISSPLTRRHVVGDRQAAMFRLKHLGTSKPNHYRREAQPIRYAAYPTVQCQRGQRRSVAPMLSVKDRIAVAA